MKLWKRLAIILFSVHLIISIILFNFYYTGEFNLSSMFALFFDFPLLYIYMNLLNTDNMTLYKLYFIIGGSIFYYFIGGILGLIISKFKKK